MSQPQHHGLQMTLKDALLMLANKQIILTFNNKPCPSHWEVDQKLPHTLTNGEIWNFSHISGSQFAFSTYQYYTDFSSADACQPFL